MAVFTRLLALFLSFIAVGTLRPHQRALNDARPEGWLDRGAFHRVYFDAEDAGELQWLRQRGAVLKEVDYGRRVMAMIDESYVGGRMALLGQEWNIRDDQNRVLFDGMPLDTTHTEETLVKLNPALRLGAANRPALDPDAGLYIVQFIGPVKDEWLQEVVEAGADCFQPIPWNAFIARVAPEDTATLENLARDREEIQYVGVYEPAFRMTPRLRNAWLDEAGTQLDITVQLVDGTGVREELAALERSALAWDGHVRVGPYLNVSMTVDPATLPALASQGHVFAVEERGVRARLDEAQNQIVAGNLIGNNPTGPGYLSWLAGKGFGAGQFGTFSINVVDDATSLTGHPDLPNGRVAFTLNPSSQGGQQGGHGFLNAHIVAGFNDGTGSTFEDASGFNYGLGIAPWALVGSTAIFGSGGSNPSSYESSAYGSGSRISTNSWSFQTGGGAPIPDYDSNSQQYDFLTRDVQSGTSGNQEYLVLFAAGNDGSGANTVSTPSTAKNILTVGASENVRQTGTDGCAVANSGANSANDMATFSSRGPINSTGGDGRWKPELVGPGTHIQAGVPQSNFDGGSSVCNGSWPPGSSLYGWSSGTSHSTPAVAGGAALVYQWFLNQSLPLPSPALTKAILANTADYMNGSGANDTLPSNSQGMGRMYLERAFDNVPRVIVDQDQLLTSTGTSYTLDGVVADNAQPFRVTVVWTDAPGPTTGAPYVNDLDLTVSVGGSTYLGNVFSGSSSTTGGTADFRNNTESVFLPAGLSGPFTVTIDATNISGDGVPGNGDSTDQDFALFVYNGSQGTGPNAQFGAAPTSGLAPLAVAFTDFSTGNITSWDWTFGDGGSSTQENPNHTYTAVGTYDVSLTIDGPDGANTITKNAFIDAQAPPPPGISDNSFESQTAGTAPASPWTIAFGSAHVVNPDGTANDNGMPSDGSNWAEVAADSTNGATPPSNPGGVTTPAIGGAGISQDFTHPVGMALLEFEAAFLRNENANQAVFNDWMSVDVSDGSTTINVYYKDTFSATSGTSTKYGYDMTAVETVSADLEALFPGSTTSTLFTVTILVGNGNDNIQPSKGYVDHFRFSGTATAPIADFSGTPTSGTAPLGVAFSDLSRGTVTGWSWTFGDGGTSSVQDPSHTYAADGTYTVALTATGPLGSDTETKAGYVTVAPPAPVADFSATPTSGVAPLSVAFTDLTSGSVSMWAWDFGDTGTSSAQNPSHSYAAAGTYTVALTAMGPGGSATETKANYIAVNEPAPVADFSGTPLSGVEPLTVNFTDLTTGPVSAWSWSFGDAGTSNAQNPSHVYASAGTYTVALTASGPGGADTETKLDYITVSNVPPVADFSGTPTTLIAGGSVAFTNLSSGAISTYSWDFGDGGSSSAQNPSHTYNALGTYTVALLVTGPGGMDTESKLDYITVIEATLADFSATPTTGIVPLAVALSDLTTGNPNAWSWSFGDGGSSSIQNPSHTYAAAGTYTVSLTADGPGGADTQTKVSYIVANEPAPVADFSGTPLTGIEPLTVAFTDLTSGPVTAWTWNFGDGGTANTQNPGHTYAAAGTYTVTLTANGPGGSDTEAKANYVTVGDAPPVADFSGTPTQLIGSGSVSFSDLSSGTASAWSWSFGDGGSSNLQNPAHLYAAPGTYTVSLTVTGPGGADTESKLDYINVLVPTAAAFSGSPTSGVSPLSVGFNDLTSGSPTAWNWTFGDGGSSSAQNPSHVYGTAGTYTVSLTASGPGGVDTATLTDYVTVFEPVVADFTGTPLSGIAPLSVNFTDQTSGGVITSWSFGDGGSSSLQNPSHTYVTPGTYTVSATALGAGGSDTESKSDYITVIAPTVADFSASPTSGVAPLTVSFNDATTPSASSWSWTFGDGNISNAQSPANTYSAAGTYSVSLTATGPGGTDGETKTNYIIVSEPAPIAQFSGTPTFGVEPLAVAFSDLSTGAITNWSWDFGDSNTSSLQGPTHTYASAGTYTVSLLVTGPGGSDGETKLDYVTVAPPAPVADFSAMPNSGLAPLLVSFTDLTTGPVTAWSWSFGDGNTSSQQNPQNTYLFAGTYTVSLTSTGPGGSSGPVTKVNFITVASPSPVAAFSGTPTSGTAPLSVGFTDLSSGIVTAWDWNFGDGSNASSQNPAHTYGAAGTYSVTLIVSGPGGSDTEAKSDYVTVSEPPPVADFAGTPLSGTEPLNVSFSDLSSGVVTSWTWAFGDGNASSLQDPSHTYATPGTYTVALTASGPGGSDTETKSDYITVGFAVPVASFVGSPTTGIGSLAVTFTDTSSGSVTGFNWDFGDGGSSTLQNPTHTYTPGTYTVSLTASGPGGMDTETRVDYITVLSPTVADFTATPLTGTAPLSVTFNDASTPSATSWSWDFGDTGTSTLQNPTHTYATPGTYTVTLVADGGGGLDAEVKTDYIVVQLPGSATYKNGTGTNPACYTATPPVLGTTWTAGVDSSVVPNALATIIFGRTEAFGPLNTMFGELLINPGSTFLFDSIRVSSGGIDTHTFMLPNDPALVGRSAETQAMVYVNGTTAQFCNAASLVVGYAPPPAPAADFSATPTSGVAPLSVNFNDASTGSITSWTWNFGDGTSSNLQNPAHTYAAPGLYTVSLVVEGPSGYDAEVKVDHVSATSGIVAERNRRSGDTQLSGGSSPPSQNGGAVAIPGASSDPKHDTRDPQLEDRNADAGAKR